MALLMTILTVAAILGGISLLLWFCAFFESRHLGPLVVDGTIDVTGSRTAEPGAAPALSMVEVVQTAA